MDTVFLYIWIVWMFFILLVVWLASIILITIAELVISVIYWQNRPEAMSIMGTMMIMLIGIFAPMFPLAKIAIFGIGILLYLKVGAKLLDDRYGDEIFNFVMGHGE